jgi:hypothetical protein
MNNATEILNYLAFSDFDEAIEITREFESLPPRPGIYTVRHRSYGVLWLDLYPPADVRIVFFPIIRWGNPALLSELEGMILRATEPPYNAQIPME